MVENHSLKPYRQRVLGTYVFIKASLTYLAQSSKKLAQAIAHEQQQRSKTQVLEWAYDSKNPLPVAFDGIEHQSYEDPITGKTQVKWLGKAKHYQALPQYWQRIAKTTVQVPVAYDPGAIWRGH